MFFWINRKAKTSLPLVGTHLHYHLPESPFGNGGGGGGKSSSGSSINGRAGPSNRARKRDKAIFYKHIQL